MELLYVWIYKSDNGVINNRGFNFSRDYDIASDFTNSTLTITLTERRNVFRYPSGNIVNISAIVGENGSGKSTVLRNIISENNDVAHLYKDGDKFYYRNSDEVITIKSINFDALDLKNVKLNSKPCYVFLSNDIFTNIQHKSKLENGYSATINHSLRAIANESKKFRNNGQTNTSGNQMFKNSIHELEEVMQLLQLSFILQESNQNLLKFLIKHIREEIVIGFSRTDDNFTNNMTEGFIKIEELSYNLKEIFVGSDECEVKTNIVDYLFYVWILIYLDKNRLFHSSKKIDEEYNHDKIKEPLKIIKRNLPVEDKIELLSKLDDFFKIDINSQYNFNKLITSFEKITLFKANKIVSKPYAGEYNWGISIKENGETLYDFIDCLFNMNFLGLVDVSYVSKNLKMIKFSSGENAFISLFTLMNYVVKPFANHTINTLPLKELPDNTNDLVFVIDEPDMYLHPEWIRRFISILIKNFNSNQYEGKKIQVIIATNNPILIGDIPSQHISILSKDKDGTFGTKETFSQNIHTILKDSFFMKNTFGEFSSDYINKLNEFLTNEIKEAKANINKEKSINEKFNDLFKYYIFHEVKEDFEDNNKKYHFLKNMISFIGEPILKKHFESLLERWALDNKLNEQLIDFYKQKIKELEGGQNDKT